jgi:hypothetical protein
MDIGEAQWLFYLLAACLVLIALTVLAPKQRIVLPRNGVDRR